VPRRLYSTALHEDHLVDPDDTYILDNVARFVGQRIAAVVGESEAAAEAGVRALHVEYEILPAVFDPVAAMEPGAPLLHEKNDVVTQNGNIFCTLQGEIGDVAQGFKEADAVHEMTYSTSRVQHVHLETHGSIAYKGDDGRWHVRTSSQGPFPVRTKLAYLMGVPPREIHVFTERVGGGFGGKQEMVSEDLPLFATMKLDGRPVKWEWTREEEFIGATTRHQMTTKVKIGAKKDGTLTAPRRALRVEYWRLRQSRQRDPRCRDGEPDRGLSLRQQKGRGPRRLHQHDPGWWIQGLRRLPDHVRHGVRHRRAGASSRHRPVRDAAQERREAGDNVESIWKEPGDASFGSYGINECLDIVERELKKATASPSPTASTGPRERAWRLPCSNAVRRPSTVQAPR